jgi:cytoskeletal protein CcmA (bactofilin family)
MRPPRPVPVALLVLGLLLVWSSAVPAQHAGGAVVVRDAAADNLYLAGGTVDVRAELAKDLVAAGGTVNVERLVKGDVTVAGGVVNIRGGVGDDIRAAGGVVTVEGDVAGDLVAVGGRVGLTPATRVGGRAWLAGGTVDVLGSVARELRIAAGTVTVSGRVDGDVRIAARDLTIGPAARIRGSLAYTSPRPARIDPAAQIEGTVSYQRAEAAVGAGRAVWGALRLVLLLGLIAAGVVLYLLLPRFTVAAAGTIRSDPWRSLGLGFALLVATPVAVVLLMVTLVGIPLGLAVAALYCVALLVGYLIAALFLGDLGDRLLRRGAPPTTGSRLAFLVAALVALALLRLIPVAGGAVLFLALVLGLGAWTIRGYREFLGGGLRPPSEPPP